MPWALHPTRAGTMLGQTGKGRAMAEPEGMDEDAKNAFEAARELIAETIVTGVTDIRFDEGGFGALTQIPIEIANIKGLERLNLAETSIRDLSPLAGITGLTDLWLFDTPVTDLSPIAGMTTLRELRIDQTGVSDLTALAGLTRLQVLNLNLTGVSDLRPLIGPDKLGEGGLWFAGTPAMRLDENLARLSEIKDAKQRAREVLAYLKTLPPWPEPLPWLMGVNAPQQIKPNAMPKSITREDLWQMYQGLSEKIDEMQALWPSNKGALSQAKKELADLKKSADSQQKTVSQTSKLLESTMGRLVDTHDQVDRFSTETTQRIAAAEAEYQQSIDGALKAIDGALKAFTEGNRIKAPVKLWAEKQAEHRAAMRWRGRAFVASILLSMTVACGVIYGLIAYGATIDGLFTPITCDKAKPETCGGFSTRGLLATGSVLTIFTLLLWFARLQMKLFLAERHLALDAREREAFAQTYVGLLNEDPTTGNAAQAKEQHALVYAALFRPGSDGTVKEEGGFDPAISAAISKFLSK